MRMAGTRFGRELALVGALQLALATGALASAEHPEGNEVRDRPILFEQNDTYYELVTLPPTFHYQALRLASKRTYKDRRGRLAIVDSKEVNDFLRDTFKPSTLTWIGLRYWCGRGRLERSDGSVQKLSQYSNWATPWNTSGSDRIQVVDGKPRPPLRLTCYDKTQAWGVHYWSLADGFQWNANGWLKHGWLMFVEYPPIESKDEKVSHSENKAPAKGAAESGS